MAKITYRLKPEAAGKAIEWKDEERGVKVLFVKGGGGLVASVVTFDAAKFTRPLAERWLANRVNQYCLNSYISELTSYESALLRALTEYDPRLKAMADGWRNAPANTKETAHTSAIRVNDPVWELQAKVYRKTMGARERRRR